MPTPEDLAALHKDPPPGYEVRAVPTHDGEYTWTPWAIGLGRDGPLFDTRDQAVLRCWEHRAMAVLEAIVQIVDLDPLCAACGWPKHRGHPTIREEPPIVSGACNAQADAERRLFAVLRRLPAMRDWSVAQIRELLNSTSGGDTEAGPIGTARSSPAPTLSVATGVDLLPPGIPDGT